MKKKNTNATKHGKTGNIIARYLLRWQKKKQTKWAKTIKQTANRINNNNSNWIKYEKIKKSWFYIGQYIRFDR